MQGIGTKLEPTLIAVIVVPMLIVITIAHSHGVFSDGAATLLALVVGALGLLLAFTRRIGGSAIFATGVLVVFWIGAGVALTAHTVGILNANPNAPMTTSYFAIFNGFILWTMAIVIAITSIWPSRRRARTAQSN